MSEELPAPLVPADVDLRGLPFMPLDTVRLLDSDLFALASGDEFKAAVALWCKSWQQVPAGSLPDDDRILAHLSGAGARWRKIKAMALHGFTLCSDGRWYHPVIAEKAAEAWSRRIEQRKRAAKRWNSHGDAGADAAGDAAADAMAMQGTGTGTGTVSTDDASASSERPTNAKRATRIPDDWQPDLEDRAFAEQLGLGPILDSVIGEFRDYWRGEGGKHARKVSWSLTFRVRCRQLAERRRANGAGRPGSSAAAPDYSTPVPQHRTPKTPPPTC